jgi:hypothetical protein
VAVAKNGTIGVDRRLENETQLTLLHRIRWPGHNLLLT